MITDSRTTEQLYVLAVQRVEDVPALREIADFILTDWPNWREHLEWVLTAPVSDILAWHAASQ